MNAFRVSFLIPGNKLGTALAQLYNEISDLKVIEETPAIVPSQVNSTDRRHTPRKSPLYDFAVAYVAGLKSGDMVETTPEGNLGRALTAAGMKCTNASPLGTMLVENGYVRRVGKGKAVVL